MLMGNVAEAKIFEFMSPPHLFIAPLESFFASFYINREKGWKRNYTTDIG